VVEDGMFAYFWLLLIDRVLGYVMIEYIGVDFSVGGGGGVWKG
jgi:hypothetical protein